MPLVVLDGRSPVQKPIAMNEYARHKGVQTEMPKTLLEQCPSCSFGRVPILWNDGASGPLASGKELLAPGRRNLHDTLIMDLAGMNTLFGQAGRSRPGTGAAA